MSLLLISSFVAPAPPAFVSAFAASVACMDDDMLEAFGEPVIYQPAAGAPVTVAGICDAGYLLTQGEAMAGVQTRARSVFLRLADLPIDPDLDNPVLTIRGVNYGPVITQPDGMGGTVIRLRTVT